MLAVSSLVLLLGGIAMLAPGQAQTVPASQCATGIHAILLRGQGPGDNLNVLGTISTLILQQIPGSTTLGLPYGHNDQDKQAAVHDGALMLQNYVTEYVSSCPESKILLLGYSLGADTMMDALCGTSSALFDPVEAIDPSYAQNIIVAVGYADETYVPLQSWNAGNCTLGAGEFPRLNPGSCEPFAAALRDYCDYGDAQCCGPLPADNNTVHHNYVHKYNQDVVDFAKQRLAETKRK